MPEIGMGTETGIGSIISINGPVVKAKHLEASKVREMVVAGEKN